MSSQLYPTDLPTVLDRAKTAWKQARGALVALAKALATPSHVPNALAEVKAALDKAKTELKGAEDALAELQVASKDVKAPAVARGTLGDEDDEELEAFGNQIRKEVERLEEQEKWARQCQKRLQTGHVLVMGLMTLCGFLLSLDAVRTALGVAKDSHLLLVLGGVAVSCQVSAQALATSRRHLGDTARQHRLMAQRLRDRAERVRTARDNADTTADTRGKIADALVRLEEMTLWLGMLVDAVKEDMATEATPEQRFHNAEQKLKRILTGLETSEKHGEVTLKTLKEVWDVLTRQGAGTGRGHGGGTVTSRGTGDLLALGTPGPL